MAEKKDRTAKPAATPAATSPKPVHIGGESFVERLMPHMKKVLVAFLVVGAILSVVFTLRWMKDRRLEGQTTKVAAVLDIRQRQVQPEPADPTAKKAADTYPTSKARAEALLAEIAKQGTDQVSPLVRASAQFEAGKLDEALAGYQAMTSAPDLDGVLAREGVTLTLEAKALATTDATASHQGLEAALAAARAIQPDEGGPRRAYALYHEGRLLLLLEKKTEARTVLTKAKELGKETDLPELIEARLAMLGAS